MIFSFFDHFWSFLIIFERKVTDRPYPEQAEAGSEEEEGAKARSGGARKALNESDAVYRGAWTWLLARWKERGEAIRMNIYFFKQNLK